jgi:hypothetical protein
MQQLAVSILFHCKIYLKLHMQTLVPVVAYAVLNIPDDGCKEHPKHVERFYSEIK